MIAVAVVALCWSLIVRPLMRPYPIFHRVTTNFRGRWELLWSDGTFTTYDRREDQPALDSSVMGPLAWVKWSDGSYSLRLRETRQSPKVEPRLGVPSVGKTTPF